MAEVFSNNASGNLNAGITNGATSLVLQAGQGSMFPATGNFRILIDNELIIVGARSGDTLSSLTRGAETTTAASHASGAVVEHIITAGALAAMTINPSQLSGYPNSVTKILKGDGSWPTGYALITVRLITATGTYTASTGTKAVYVEAVGGGGGSGGAAATAAAQNTASGGGGGGAYSAAFLTSGFSGLTATIGAAGAAGAAGANAGGNGGDTSLGTLVVAKGGLGGNGSAAGAAAVSAAAVTGGLASGGTGDIKINGGAGGAGFVAVVGAVNIGGAGGASFFAGAPAQIGGGTGAGNPGNLYGGGASGSVSFASQAAQAGAAGAAGLIRIWEFA